MDGLLRLSFCCEEVEGPLVGIDGGLPLGIDDVEGLSVGVDEELSLGDNEGILDGLSLGKPGVMASHCA